MKALAAMALTVGLLAAAPASAGDFDLRISVGGPRYYAPYYPRYAPVVVYDAPVVVHSAPVVVDTCGPRVYRSYYRPTYRSYHVGGYYPRHYRSHYASYRYCR